MPGTVFAGSYRIVRKLAEGGMGAVYVADQLTTGRQRALKLMHPVYVGSPELRERFSLEARVGALVESEHVVEVIGAGVDDDVPWIAMELLSGRDLAAELRTSGRLSEADCGRVLGQVGHALSAAHRAGIVHRDLKPENVFLAQTKRVHESTTVKLLDFGIAAMLSDEQTRATVTSAIGTPLWWAPEQMQAGDHVAPYTDVWAFGLLVFYALTGRSYWRSAYDPSPSVALLVDELFNAPLPLASERARLQGFHEPLPAGFDAWLSTCVVRDPRARFRDGRAATAALLPLLVAAKGTRSGMPAMPFRSSLPPEPPSSGGASARPVTNVAFAATALAPAAAPAPTAPTPHRFAAPGPQDTLAVAPKRSSFLFVGVIGVGAVVATGLAGLVYTQLAWQTPEPTVHATLVTPPHGEVAPTITPEPTPEPIPTALDVPEPEPLHGTGTHHHTTTVEAPPVEPPGGVHAVLSGSEPGHLAAALAPPEVAPVPAGGAPPAEGTPPPTADPPPAAPRTIVFDGTSATRQVGNTEGGDPFNDTCGAGAALVGLSGNSVPYLGRLGAVCARLSLPASGAGAITVGAPIDLAVRGRSGGGTSRITCGDDEVMVGFRGRAGALVDRLSLICAPLSVDASGHVTVGPEHGSSAAIGGSGGEDFGTLLCREGRIGRVARIRAGDGADAFGLGCAVPSVGE